MIIRLLTLITVCALNCRPVTIMTEGYSDENKYIYSYAYSCLEIMAKHDVQGPLLMDEHYCLLLLTEITNSGTLAKAGDIGRFYASTVDLNHDIETWRNYLSSALVDREAFISSIDSAMCKTTYYCNQEGCR